MIFAVSAAVHRHLLSALEGDNRRRRSRSAHLLPGRLPFVNAAVSAIAIAQFRNAMRSVRGRLIVLLPGPMIAILTMLFRGMPDEYRWASTLATQGHLVLAAGSVFAIYAMQAFTMNLFGSDRTGLSMYFLAPVDDADLALGKVVGAALVLEVAVVISLVASLAVAPTGSPFYWLATIAGAIATFLVLSPFAIWLSALFPVASDLSKTGAGGNPHPFPMLVGMVLTLVAAAPAGLILAADELWIHRPGAAFLFMLVWTFMAAAIAMPLVGLASRTIGARRENLALLRQRWLTVSKLQTFELQTAELRASQTSRQLAATRAASVLPVDRLDRPTRLACVQAGRFNQKALVRLNGQRLSHFARPSDDSGAKRQVPCRSNWQSPSFPSARRRSRPHFPSPLTGLCSREWQCLICVPSSLKVADSDRSPSCRSISSRSDVCLRTTARPQIALAPPSSTISIGTDAAPAPPFAAAVATTSSVHCPDNPASPAVEPDAAR